MCPPGHFGHGNQQDPHVMITAFFSAGRMPLCIIIMSWCAWIICSVTWEPHGRLPVTLGGLAACCTGDGQESTWGGTTICTNAGVSIEATVAGQCLSHAKGNIIVIIMCFVCSACKICWQELCNSIIICSSLKSWGQRIVLDKVAAESLIIMC